jgi:hypothetical protein
MDIYTVSRTYDDMCGTGHHLVAVFDSYDLAMVYATEKSPITPIDATQRYPESIFYDPAWIVESITLNEPRE